MSKTMWQLLISFLQIGLFSIGGGYATIPLIQEQVVERHHWLNFQEYTDIITLSQMTPGPLAINTSTFVGIRIAGIPGALIATFGCVISGFIISLLLYQFFHCHGRNTQVIFLLKGLGATSIGLIASAAATILLIALCNTSVLSLHMLQFNYIAASIFIIALFILRKFKTNPLLVMALSGIAGLLLY